MVAHRANSALELAFSRDDVGWFDWTHALGVLWAATALPGADGMESRALERAMELSAERFGRLPKRDPLPEVMGEAQMTPEEVVQAAASMLRHGGQGITMAAMTMRCADLAGRPLTDHERVRLVRVVRSNLAVREVDRYLGAPRQMPADLPGEPLAALETLEDRAMAHLEGIQPDQVYRGSRMGFVGELIHAITHSQAVRFLLERGLAVGTVALTRLGEQVNAQQKLVEIRAEQQFDELPEPASLSFLDLLGMGFDDPYKLTFACAARELWDRRGRPDEWVPLIGRTLGALE